MRVNPTDTYSDSRSSNTSLKCGLLFALIATTLVSAVGATPAQPDFGPNVLIFNRSMPSATIQAQIDKVYATQRRNEFGPDRNAFLFFPGDYTVDVPIGFYTQVLGLGDSPDSVHITGNVHSDAAARANPSDTCSSSTNTVMRRFSGTTWPR